MQKIIIIISVLAMLLLREECHGQSGSVRYTAGINYTVGVPTFVPNGNVSKVAIDTGTMKWYEYAQVGGWRWSGDRVQDISGCAAPSYTPGKAQSRLVMNACTEAQNGHGPELYKYTGSAWLCLNCGGNYTAGTGIDISGTVISNTAPDQVVSITGAGINAVTGTYPNFTVTGTEVDGSVTNELQTLSVAGNNLTISDGNTVTLPTPSSTLDGLTDVIITSPSNNQILQYSSAGSQWVNATLAAITGSGTTDRVARWSNSSTVAAGVMQDNGTRAGIGAINSQTVWNVESTSTITSGAQYGQIILTTVNPPSASTATNTAFRNYMSLYGSANLSGQIISNSSVIVDGNSGVKTTVVGTDTNITGSAGTTTTVSGYSTTIAYGNTPVKATTMRGYTAVLKGNADVGSCYYGRSETYYVRTPTDFRVFDADLSTVVVATTPNSYGIYQSGNPTGAKNYLESQLGIGNASPSATAKLEVTSTTQGVLFPRMTATQRDAIASPPDGLVVYNTTSAKLQVRAASAWVDLH